MQTTLKANKKCRNNEIGQCTELKKFDTVKLDEILGHFSTWIRAVPTALSTKSNKSYSIETRDKQVFQKSAIQQKV